MRRSSSGFLVLTVALSSCTFVSPEPVAHDGAATKLEVDPTPLVVRIDGAPSVGRPSRMLEAWSGKWLRLAPEDKPSPSISGSVTNPDVRVFLPNGKERRWKHPIGEWTGCGVQLAGSGVLLYGRDVNAPARARSVFLAIDAKGDAPIWTRDELVLAATTRDGAWAIVTPSGVSRFVLGGAEVWRQPSPAVAEEFAWKAELTLVGETLYAATWRQARNSTVFIAAYHWQSGVPVWQRQIVPLPLGKGPAATIIRAPNGRAPTLPFGLHDFVLDEAVYAVALQEIEGRLVLAAQGPERVSVSILDKKTGNVLRELSVAYPKPN